MQVVLLTHYFPPIGGPASRRMLGWCGGWRDAGVDVTVVTPRADPVDPYFQQQADPIPDGVEVVTVPIFDPARLVRNRSATATGKTGAGGGGRMAGLRRWLLLPDQRRLANAQLVAAAAPVCRRGKTVLVTSSPYNSVHLAGQKLKRLIPNMLWVADFRDDWFHPVFFPFPNALYRRLNLHWEGKVLQHADLRVTVNETIRDKAIARHPLVTDRDGWLIVPNGYDSGIELPKPLPRQVADGVIDLLYAGTLWDNQPLQPLVDALEKVAANHDRQVRLEIAGRVAGDPPEGTPHIEVIATPWRPYSEMLARMAAADFLLVHAGTEPEVMTGKIFDCARVQRPVVVLGPPHAELVRFVRRQISEPFTAAADDTTGLLKVAERIISGPALACAFAGMDAVYDRRRQANRVLERLGVLA